MSLVVGHVESLTGVPRSLFHLVGASGHRLQEDVTLVQSGIGPDSSLFMSAHVPQTETKTREQKHKRTDTDNDKQNKGAASG